MSLTLHTSLGDLKIELALEKAPKNCENFLALAASHQYDGTVFHRSVPGFLIQGGSPTGKGKDSTAVHGTPVPHEFHPLLKHSERGVVGMAASGVEGNGSQFYITYSKIAELDRTSTVIGKLIAGHDVLDTMEAVPVAGKKHKPEEPIVLQSVTIHANPLASDAST